MSAWEHGGIGEGESSEGQTSNRCTEESYDFVKSV